jgi:serine/threonine-protein kinase RsbW
VTSVDRVGGHLMAHRRLEGMSPAFSRRARASGVQTSRVMSRDDSLSESYPAVANSVPTARNAVVAFAAAAGLASQRLDGLRLAVSEALSNVVVHAYPDVPGEIHLAASVAGGELWVSIADDGAGLSPRVLGPGLGLGLGLIAHETDELKIAKRAGGGTELQLRFKLRATRPAAELQSRAPVAPANPAAVSSIRATT